MMTWVGVALAGSFGAVARYGTDRAVQHRWPGTFPLGTFVVNVTGCLALGVVAGLLDAGRVGGDTADVVGSGLLGAFTTFSTFGYETVRLVEHDRPAVAARNVVASLVMGLIAAAVGLAIGSSG